MGADDPVERARMACLQRRQDLAVRPPVQGATGAIAGAASPAVKATAEDAWGARLLSSLAGLHTDPASSKPSPPPPSCLAQQAAWRLIRACPEDDLQQRLKLSQELARLGWLDDARETLKTVDPADLSAADAAALAHQRQALAEVAAGLEAGSSARRPPGPKPCASTSSESSGAPTMGVPIGSPRRADLAPRPHP